MDFRNSNIDHNYDDKHLSTMRMSWLMFHELSSIVIKLVVGEKRQVTSYTVYRKFLENNNNFIKLVPLSLEKKNLRNKYEF